MLLVDLACDMAQLPAFLWQTFQVDLDIDEQARLNYGDHSRQYVLLAKPKGQPKAWLIYWHGGGWQFGRPEQFLAGAQPWIDRGYGVILPSYRRIPFHQYSHIEEDLIVALQVSRNWMEKRGMHDLPIGLLGMSAGGHLAAMTALQPAILESAGFDRRQLLGAITCAAVLDLDEMPPNYVTLSLAGPKGRPLYQRANPRHHLTPEAPPFLVIHGTRDGMVPVSSAHSFLQAYQQVTGSECGRWILDGKGHLDVGRWLFENGELRRRMLTQMDEWLTGRS